MRQKQTGILGRRNSLSKGSEVETARPLGKWVVGQRGGERRTRRKADSGSCACHAKATVFLFCRLDVQA